MVLWIIMAVLAAAAALPVLVPLFRASRIQPTANAARSIYRDQLDEVERDRGRGLIADQEAEAARTEIARRLLKTGEGASAHRTTPARQRLAAAVVIAMPLLALALYVALGSPGMPDQPLAARLSAPVEKQDPAIILARLENHLAANPDDATGWDFIARIYSRLERYDDEARALANLIRIRGADLELETAYGEALTRANGNLVTKEARTAFEQANKLDPQAIAPRFFLAIALTQEGKKEEAIAAWTKLLEGAPADAPWVQIGRNALASLNGTQSGAPPAAVSSGPGPSDADVQAAQGLTPEQRLAMINGMVTQLAGRLEADPSDAEGWARLIRSYMVLGRSDDAKAALAKARTALAAKSDLLARVEAEAKSVGVPQ
jgi:cytochrome c-type biogenesis protein CcmH